MCSSCRILLGKTKIKKSCCGVLLNELYTSAVVVSISLATSSHTLLSEWSSATGTRKLDVFIIIERENLDPLRVNKELTLYWKKEHIFPRAELIERIYIDCAESEEDFFLFLIKYDEKS